MSKSRNPHRLATQWTLKEWNDGRIKLWKVNLKYWPLEVFWDAGNATVWEARVEGSTAMAKSLSEAQMFCKDMARSKLEGALLVLDEVSEQGST